MRHATFISNALHIRCVIIFKYHYESETAKAQNSSWNLPLGNLVSNKDFLVPEILNTKIAIVL